MRLNEAVQLVLLAEEKNRPLLVAQNYRYHSFFYRTARRLIAEGALGTIHMVNCQY
jgi:predicted dehydrogenase